MLECVPSRPLVLDWIQKLSQSWRCRTCAVFVFASTKEMLPNSVVGFSVCMGGLCIFKVGEIEKRGCGSVPNLRAMYFVLRHFEISGLNDTSHCTQWPLSIILYQLNRVICTHTLTHCGHKANKQCTGWPLRQTNFFLPDTVTFPAELENRASLDPRQRTVIYDYC